MIFHPLRRYRNFMKSVANRCFILRCALNNIKCTIGKGSVVKGCSLTSRGSGIIKIGDYCDIRHTCFKFYDDGGCIDIRNYVFFNARPKHRNGIMSVKGHTKITIDEECLFSNSIDIATTDWHAVIDKNGDRINHDKDVYIGKHVWIGRKVTVCKGVSIAENSIIGTGSVVTKPFTESNVVIAGNPAKICKRDVSWK